MIDFEIPKKYGLRQTIGDTMGIGGIFRTLRTLPVMLEFAREMEEVCPQAWLLNYTNPMAMLTMGILKATKIKTVGLCHSVQVCVSDLFKQLGISEQYQAEEFQWKIAGINHMAFLLELTKRRERFLSKNQRTSSSKTTSSSRFGAFRIDETFWLLHHRIQ